MALAVPLAATETNECGPGRHPRPGLRPKVKRCPSTSLAITGLTPLLMQCQYGRATSSPLRDSVCPMPDPNFADKTIWTDDNLDILRGMNSECVDLIYLDPPFTSNREVLKCHRTKRARKPTKQPSMRESPARMKDPSRPSSERCGPTPKRTAWWW